MIDMQSGKISYLLDGCDYSHELNAHIIAHFLVNKNCWQDAKPFPIPISTWPGETNEKSENTGR